MLVAEEPRSTRVAGYMAARAPGLALSLMLASPADILARRTSLSPLLWASVAGIATGPIWRALGLTNLLAPGVGFAKARLLRLGIILYGFKLTLQQLKVIGLAGLSADCFTVCTTMLLGHQLGVRVLRMPLALTTLISSGASICGCSAVVATQPVAQGEPHEVAAAVATVVLYGTIAMFLYPLLWSQSLIAISPRLMGIFTGATVHELAGVVAAGNAMGPEVASIALVTKLVRVCMLAPMLLFLSSLNGANDNKASANDNKAGVVRTTGTGTKAPLPWFALGFLAIALLNSVFTFDQSLIKRASTLSASALVAAMVTVNQNPARHFP